MEWRYYRAIKIAPLDKLLRTRGATLVKTYLYGLTAIQAVDKLFTMPFFTLVMLV